MPTTLKNVSIMTVGSARGHDLMIDQKTLEQAMAVAKSMGRIKVTNGHGAAQVMDILGYVENFAIKGDKLVGDLTLLNGEKADYVANLAREIPDQFGLSLTFSGVPDLTDGQRFARVTEIYDVSVVTRPAANASLFTAFSACAVDMFAAHMTENKVETKLEAAPVAEPAPAPEPVPAIAPVALAEMPKEDKEPTIRDVVNMLSQVIEKMNSYYGDKMDKEDEEMSAPAPVAEVTPVPEVEKLQAENTALKIELEAKKGTAPVEMTEAKPLSRNELLSKFNEEKDPRRAAEIFNQIKLAR